MIATASGFGKDKTAARTEWRMGKTSLGWKRLITKTFPDIQDNTVKEWENFDEFFFRCGKGIAALALAARPILVTVDYQTILRIMAEFHL